MDKIENIRNQFENEVRMFTSKYNQTDIQRVRDEDFQIRRFLIDSNDDEKVAFNKLTKALEWKNRIGIHRLSESDFPSELYELGKFEKFGFDKEGRALVWESARHQRYYPELDRQMKQFIAFTFETIDRMAGEKGFVHIVDFKGAPLMNFDPRLAAYRVKCSKNYYPQSIKKMVFLNLPIFVKPFSKFAVKFYVPEHAEMVQYCTNDELQVFIEKKYIHTDLKGDRVQRYYPTNTRPLREIYHKFGLDKKFVDKFYKEYYG